MAKGAETNCQFSLAYRHVFTYLNAFLMVIPNNLWSPNVDILTFFLPMFDIFNLSSAHVCRIGSVKANTCSNVKMKKSHIKNAFLKVTTMDCSAQLGIFTKRINSMIRLCFCFCFFIHHLIFIILQHFNISISR